MFVMNNSEIKKPQANKADAKSVIKPRPIHYDFTYKKPFPSPKTIDELLREGYVGIDRRLATDNAFAAVAYKFRDRIKWTISTSTEPDVWLMTTNKQALQKLSEFMLNQFSWSPMIYTEKPERAFIFTPKNDTERAAIEATISGEYGWQGSLYSLELYEHHNNKAGFIFTTKPLDSPQQEWLLVQLNFAECTGCWSHHEGSIKQVYYIWKENIQLSEPNYNPTTDEILDAIQE